MSSEKGNFSADISEAAIREALKSVEKAAEHPDEGTEVSVESSESSPESAPVAAAPSEVEELRAQLDLSQEKARELFEKHKDTHERMLRAGADLENYRKRAQKEKEEAQRYGNEKLLKDLLPVMDNLDRALEHAKANVAAGSDAEGLTSGVQMTRKLFEDVLAKHGVRGFVALGQPFDPRMHEAMGHEETDQVPPNQVIRELMRGYWLHERLVRPALVMVSKAKTAVETTLEKPQGEGT